MNRDSGASRLVKLLVPLALIGIAVFQVVVNRGHVDDNVIGALVFIAVGGTAGYAIDRIIQNLYWARTTGGVDRKHPEEGRRIGVKERRRPHGGVYVGDQKRKRKRRNPGFEDVRETPDAVTEEA